MRNKISSDMLKKFVGVSEEVLAHELYLNYDQIKLMKNEGMFFGIHGYDHYWMNQLEEDKLKKDINRGLEVLSDVVDINQWVINYPYGSYSEKVVDCIKDSGCILGLSTDVNVANLEKDNKYILPRMDTNDYPPKNQDYKFK